MIKEPYIYYQKHTVNITASENEPLPKTSIMDSMIMLKKSWYDVTEKTIVNCFRRAEIFCESKERAVEEEDDHSKTYLIALMTQAVFILRRTNRLRRIVRLR